MLKELKLKIEYFSNTTVRALSCQTQRSYKTLACKYGGPNKILLIFSTLVYWLWACRWEKIPEVLGRERSTVTLALSGSLYASCVVLSLKEELEIGKRQHQHLFSRRTHFTTLLKWLQNFHTQRYQAKISPQILENAAIHFLFFAYSVCELVWCDFDTGGEEIQIRTCACAVATIATRRKFSFFHYSTEKQETLLEKNVIVVFFCAKR